MWKMTQNETSYFGCKRVHVFLEEVDSLVDPDGDGGENHVETGLGAEAGRHLDHCVWIQEEERQAEFNSVSFCIA